MSNERRAMLIRPFCLFVAFFPCAPRRESLDRFNTATSRQGKKNNKDSARKTTQYNNMVTLTKKKQHICAVDGACVSVCVGIRRCCEGSGGA